MGIFPVGEIVCTAAATVLACVALKRCFVLVVRSVAAIVAAMVVAVAAIVAAAIVAAFVSTTLCAVAARVVASAATFSVQFPK